MAKELDPILPEEPASDKGNIHQDVVPWDVSPKVAVILEWALPPTKTHEDVRNLDAKFEAFPLLIQDIAISIDTLWVMRFHLNDGTHLVWWNIGKRLIFRYENPGNQAPNVQEGVDTEGVRYYSLYGKYWFEFDTDWAIGNESGDGKWLSFTLLSKSNETSKSIEALLKSIDSSDWYISCAPIVIINLLLEKRELLQYIPGEEDSYFCFRFWEREIWFSVNKNYFAPPQFIANNPQQ